MGIEKNKNQLFIIALTVGFFMGILYENLFAGNQGTAPELFQKSTLQQYLQLEVVSHTYLWYVLKERMLFVGALYVIGFLKWKKAVTLGFLGLCGFLFGMLSVSSVLNLGIGGLFLCILGLLPHGVFYGMGLVVLLYHWYRYPNRKWNRMKLLFCFVVFILGILSEVYVNPWIMKWIIPIVLY